MLLANRKRRRNNTDSLHPERAPGQPSKSTQRRNMLGLTRKAKKAVSAAKNTKPLTGYFQTLPHKKPRTEDLLLTSTSQEINDTDMQMDVDTLSLSHTVMISPNTSADIFPFFPNSTVYEQSSSLILSNEQSSSLASSNEQSSSLVSSGTFLIPVEDDFPDGSSSVTLNDDLPISPVDPIPPVTNDEDSDSQSDPASDSEINEHTGVNYEAEYKKLKTLIDKHVKRLREKKIMIQDSSAPSKVVELEALRQYAKARLVLQRKLHARKQKIASASPHLRHILRKQIPARWSQSARTASVEVASCLGKGTYYARHLRIAAHHLLKTGLILENKQGQGAVHASLLNRLDVRESVRKWARGLVSEEDGGFKGRVSQCLELIIVSTDQT
ncbi:hypothetical protein GGU11DRAFT_751827 [Lentinula aff. detonsa]|nr:hypothetical protein GGU11DRAFT_751827 [Lentinula aff. detonsa]